MYGIRHKWIPVYMQNVFFVRMKSTQQSESMTSFLKNHVTKKNTLLEFLCRFEIQLQLQREKENQGHHRTFDKRAKLITNWSLEAGMEKIYTRSIFYYFQCELTKSLMLNVRYVRSDQFIDNYIVSKVGNEDLRKEIFFCKITCFANCSCQMLEFKGIPCKHLLAFFKFSNYKELPEQYIFRRWSQDLKIGFKKQKESQQHSGNNLEWYYELNKISSTLIDQESCKNHRAFVLADSIILEGLKNMLDMKATNIAENQSTTTVKDNQTASLVPEIRIQEPLKAKPKGSGRSGRPKGSTNRYKAPYEMKKNGGRRC